MFITDHELLKRNIFKIWFDLNKAFIRDLSSRKPFSIVQESSCIVNNNVVFHRSVAVKLYVVTMDLNEHKTLCQRITDVFFHKTVFYFFTPRVFSFASGWFFPSYLDWSGNYSNFAEYTIQPLDRLNLKFSVTECVNLLGSCRVEGQKLCKLTLFGP